MKKFLSVFCAWMLAMQVLYLPAVAADAENDVVFQLSTVTDGKPGDIVEIELSAQKGDVLYNSISFSSFEYDENALELVGFTVTNEELNNWFFKTFELAEDPKDSYAVYGVLEATSLEGVLGKFQFRILESVPTGDYEITLTPGVKMDNNVLASEIKVGMVSVVNPNVPADETPKADKPEDSKENDNVVEKDDTDKNDEKTEKPAKEDVSDKENDAEEEVNKDTVWENPFVDVADDAAYIHAIEFVYENGLFKGVSATEFAPDTTMTRAMFVTVLGRLHGIIEDYTMQVSFKDVVPGEWYAPYVAWAARNGIVNGYSETQFGVNDEITVEQATVILARYAAFNSIDTTVDYNLAADYADAATVASWATDAMTWAVAEGIYVPETALVPQTPASRALVATMLYNFVD